MRLAGGECGNETSLGEPGNKASWGGGGWEGASTKHKARAQILDMLQT